MSFFLQRPSEDSTMRTSLSIGALALAALVPSPARADNPPPTPDVIAAINEGIAELEAAVKSKDDAAATAAVKKMPGLFKDGDAALKTRIAKELGDLVKQTKLPTARLEALKALVDTGDGAIAWKGLAGAYPADDAEDPNLFNAEIVRAVGELHPEGAIDKLLTTFQKAKQPELAAAAALALGGYRKSKRRTAILEELVKSGKNMMPSQSKGGPAVSEDVRKRWGLVGQGIGKGLDNLTGTTIGDPVEWFKKYDESKKNVKALFKD
jgi:hypothetical protein